MVQKYLECDFRKNVRNQLSTHERVRSIGREIVRLMYDKVVILGKSAVVTKGPSIQ